MRSQTSGPITALILFVPLIGVPILAVCGMPQLTPRSAGAQPDELQFADQNLSRNALESRGNAAAAGAANEPAPAPAPAGISAAPPHARTAANAFADFDRSRDPADRDAPPVRKEALTSSSGPGRTDGHNGAPQRPLLAFGEAGDERGRAVGSEAARNTTQPATDHARLRADANATGQQQADPSHLHAQAQPAARDAAEAHSARDAADAPAGARRSPLSWKAAVEKLNAFGIRDYRLQPGARESDFHFSCQIVSRNNPRLARRFEAEAAEPLEAFQNVLDQIADWNARRRDRAAERPRSDGGEPQTTDRRRVAEETSVSAIDAGER